MRISDWSSDVCSSDLMETSGVTTSVPPALRQLTVAVMSQPGRAAAGALTLISTRPALASSDTLKAPVAAADQLGRATCRERECPYVYLSEAAVSLKKKTSHSKGVHTRNIPTTT